MHLICYFSGGELLQSRTWLTFRPATFGEVAKDVNHPIFTSSSYVAGFLRRHILTINLIARVKHQYLQQSIFSITHKLVILTEVLKMYDVFSLKD